MGERPKPEEIVANLPQADFLTAQAVGAALQNEASGTPSLLCSARSRLALPLPRPSPRCGRNAPQQTKWADQ